MLSLIKRIILRMKEIARKIWSILIPVFVVLIGFIIQALIFLEGKSYQTLILILLASLALICLVVGVTMLIYDFRITWKKEHKFKSV